MNSDASNPYLFEAKFQYFAATSLLLGEITANRLSNLKRRSKIIRIIHADANYIIRGAMKNLLKRDAPHIQIVAETNSFEDLIHTLSLTPADILILGGENIGASTNEILPVVKKSFPKIKILLFGLGGDITTLTSWIHILDGQVNFGTEIVSALESLMRGEKIFSLPISQNYSP